MMNRRTFIKSATFGYIVATRRVAASDRLRIAHIGLNGMGTSHLKWFANLPEAEVVALCDVDSTHLEKAKKVLDGIRPENKADLYKDFRNVLDRTDIDAVSYATPDHWHAQMAIMAFESGKHVYGEKPLSYTQREGKMMLAAQEKYGKAFQLGTQIHSFENYHRVAELIQNGVIGTVKNVHIFKTGNPPVIGQLTYPKVPETLDYNMWLGPAPSMPYSPEKTHFNYRYFMEFSGGVFQDFWCHIADIVWWAANPTNLKSVEAKGGLGQGVATTPSWLNIDYQFENLHLKWTSDAPNIPWAKDKGIGAVFYGDRGTLCCDYFSKQIEINGVIMEDVPSIQKSITRSPGHQQNFLDAIKTHTQPESNLAYARQMTMPMHLGLIAWQRGTKLIWNAKKEKFKSDRLANDLLFREYRKEFDWV